MRRRITITGGYSDFVVGQLQERTGKTLVGVDIRLTLVPVDEPLPNAESDDWLAPDLPADFDGTSHVTLSHLVNEDRYQPGTYWLYALPIDNPTKTPVKASDCEVELT